MPESRSPLARLVLFMFCLSVAGAFIAGVHYAAIDLPQQQSVTAPTNAYQDMTPCLALCDAKYPKETRQTLEGAAACAECYYDCVNRYFPS